MPDRRLAAVMFTDMVGFTGLSQRNEPLALRLRGEQQAIVRSQLSAHHGREIKTLGDGFLVEFPSIIEAVRCAVRIQSDISQRNRGTDEADELRLRIGIHVGDVVVEGGDILGDAVNLAARIEASAGPGEVLISGEAADQVANKLPYRLEKLPAMALRNVLSPVTLYRVGFESGATPAEGRPGTGQDRARIAILPFANISQDPQDEYFADGLTDELIGVVSRIPGVSVISRTSIMRYKDATKPVGEVGRELRVGNVLEGTVRKAGNRVRISAQLIDVRRDQSLWSKKFDRELSDVFAIQEEVAAQVAQALQPRLTPPADGASGVHRTLSSEAYACYLRGRFFWNRGTKEWLLRALEQFKSAQDLDPSYGPAYAGAADAHLLLGRRGDVPPRDAYPKAVDSALRALQLEPTLAEPHAALGSIRQEYEWKWTESEAEFKQATRLNPSYATAHSWYALFLGHVGRFDESLAEASLAQDLDPLAHRIHAGAAEEFIFARQYDQAIRAAERALELEPTFGSAHAYIAEALVEQGSPDRAVQEFENAGRLLGAQAWMGRLGHAQALAGRGDEAKRTIETLLEGVPAAPSPNPFLAPSPYTSLDLGLVYLGLGDLDSAMDWLERARDERVPEVVHFGAEPIYDPVQKEPRFRAILSSIGLG